MSEQKLSMIDSILVFLYTRYYCPTQKSEAGHSHHVNAAVTLSTHHRHVFVTSPQLILGQTVRGSLPKLQHEKKTDIEKNTRKKASLCNICVRYICSI